MNFLTAKDIKNMFLLGAKTLSSNVSTINELNVFPVPDGDTGNNMLLTIEGGVNKIINLETNKCCELISEFSKGAMLGARGNSGVILSQFFKGLANSLKGLETASIDDFINALSLGVTFAYNAVEKPVEGTILTVFKDSTNYVCSRKTTEYTFDMLIKDLLDSAIISLNNTKELLPVLKEADVVDSGGAGYVCILQGFLKAISGETVEYDFNELTINNKDIDYSLFTAETVMQYGYCTELTVRLLSSKIDIDSFDKSIIVDYLVKIGGDSIVVNVDDDLVKIHVHTFTPGLILTELQKYGEFLALKIENMTLQNLSKNSSERKPLAIVAVASGAGVKKAFSELSVDYIIDGGQTANPSTNDFITAFDKVNADKIVVLPNNSNIILTAKQASSLYTNSKVYVLESKSIQQGYIAVSVFDTLAEDVESAISEAEEVISGVTTIDVTYAIKDAVIDGKAVKCGEFMAISGKNLLSVGETAVETALHAISQVDNVEDMELATVFFGKALSQSERLSFEDAFFERFPDMELCPYDGGQDVYSLLISIE